MFEAQDNRGQVAAEAALEGFLLAAGQLEQQVGLEDVGIEGAV
jgi:hypothetical protein